MRVRATSGQFRVFAVAGTRAIMIALDCDRSARKGLLGFAFRRTRAGGASKWLRSQKVFKSVVPRPDLVHGDYRTNQFPIQSFLWSDYTADPAVRYDFEVHPVYGTPANPELRDPISFSITTEPEEGDDHSIWFNRGAIASQAYAREFQNHKPSDAEMNNPQDERTLWLSRGLLDACLKYLDSTRRDQKLRAAVYEFTYKPVLEAFARAAARGADVALVVHDDPEGQNRKAMKKAGLLDGRANLVIHWRTKPKIPHNKFIIRFDQDGPREVWTGSTNITASGFLGQSNVGHLIHDANVASQYFAFWNLLKDDPTAKPAKAGVGQLTPDPPPLPDKGSITCVFSPRASDAMLTWYADRMQDATSTIMFTAAFTVSPEFIPPLAEDRDFLRFVLKEKPPTKAEREAFRKDRDLVISFGAVLGTAFTIKDGRIVATRSAKEFPLDRWYLKEELTRSQGNIFFIHTKYLLIDPLGDDPLICTGSANFSKNSLVANDENMVLIRGNTRVADIYVTEFDRLFRHFYFRDVANELAMKIREGEDPEKVYLDETFTWTDSYFFQGGFKSRRREMFFKLRRGNWTTNAARRNGSRPKRS